jgi:hypothetical protein
MCVVCIHILPCPVAAAVARCGAPVRDALSTGVRGKLYGITVNSKPKSGMMPTTAQERASPKRLAFPFVVIRAQNLWHFTAKKVARHYLLECWNRSAIIPTSGTRPQSNSMELFCSSSSVVRVDKSTPPGDAAGVSKKRARSTNIEETGTNGGEEETATTFQRLGLVEWMCKSAKAMGLKSPTAIQVACIPAILNGRDILAAAEV